MNDTEFLNWVADIIKDSHSEPARRLRTLAALIADSPPESIKLGMEVRLQSGGPWMTVVRLYEAEDYELAECVYQETTPVNQYELKKISVPKVALRRRYLPTV